MGMVIKSPKNAPKRRAEQERKDTANNILDTEEIIGEVEAGELDNSEIIAELLERVEALEDK